MAMLNYVRCLMNVKFSVKKRRKEEEDGENGVKKYRWKEKGRKRGREREQNL